jgi:hypothetical protein
MRKMTTSLSPEPKPAAASTFAQPSRSGQPMSEEAIRVCAYQLWEAAGKPDSNGIRFWLEAEKELTQGVSRSL